MISRELVGASARPIILSILARQESYGYAILQRVQELSGGMFTWKDGMLYPILHRLADEKLITSTWHRTESGRKRKYYRLTKKGVKALAVEKSHWIRVNAVLTSLWEPDFQLTG